MVLGESLRNWQGRPSVRQSVRQPLIFIKKHWKWHKVIGNRLIRSHFFTWLIALRTVRTVLDKQQNDHGKINGLQTLTKLVKKREERQTTRKKTIAKKVSSMPMRITSFFILGNKGRKGVLQINNLSFLRTFPGRIIVVIEHLVLYWFFHLRVSTYSSLWLVLVVISLEFSTDHAFCMCHELLWALKLSG